MDFITRGDRDLHQTEVLYGKYSDQYVIHKLLLDAENILKTVGVLSLSKMCAKEFIAITYRTSIFEKHIVTRKYKYY